jgi:hypothetical protein
MRMHPFNPRAEKTALYNAIGVFHERWEKKRSTDAVFDLCDAVERADDVCTELRQCQLDPHSDLAHVNINLQILLAAARQELAQVQDETLEEIGYRIAEEERQTSSPSTTVLPAGTILSCPQCEEGLYKVTIRARIDDLVLDDGVMLQPLNTTIPKRDAWRALACPRCGGRYYKDGKMHTLQHGWG